MDKVNIFWFRRDLRLDDNHGFSKSLKGKYPVLPVFIFDSNILDELPKDDPRVTFIHSLVKKASDELHEHGSGMAMYHGEPLEVFKTLCEEFEVKNVITNRDYEPYALQRDKEIRNMLDSKEIGFYTFKDQVIFEKDEVVKGDGDPYVVYTPYSRKWLDKFDTGTDLKEYTFNGNIDKLFQSAVLPQLQPGRDGFFSFGH